MKDETCVTIIVRGVPRELLGRLDKLAETENRSRNGQVLAVLEEYVNSRIEHAMSSGWLADTDEIPPAWLA